MGMFMGFNVIKVGFHGIFSWISWGYNPARMGRKWDLETGSHGPFSSMIYDDLPIKSCD